MVKKVSRHLGETSHNSNFGVVSGRNLPKSKVGRVTQMDINFEMALEMAYKEAGPNAYFANGFRAGYEFAKKEEESKQKSGVLKDENK